MDFSKMEITVGLDGMKTSAQTIPEHCSRFFATQNNINLVMEIFSIESMPFLFARGMAAETKRFEHRLLEGKPLPMHLLPGLLFVDTSVDSFQEITCALRPVKRLSRGIGRKHAGALSKDAAKSTWRVFHFVPEDCDKEVLQTISQAFLSGQALYIPVPVRQAALSSFFSPAGDKANFYVGQSSGCEYYQPRRPMLDAIAEFAGPRFSFFSLAARRFSVTGDLFCEDDAPNLLQDCIMEPFSKMFLVIEHFDALMNALNYGIIVNQDGDVTKCSRFHVFQDGLSAEDPYALSSISLNVPDLHELPEEQKIAVSFGLLADIFGSSGMNLPTYAFEILSNLIGRTITDAFGESMQSSSRHEMAASKLRTFFMQNYNYLGPGDPALETAKSYAIMDGRALQDAERHMDRMKDKNRRPVVFFDEEWVVDYAFKSSIVGKIFICRIKTKEFDRLLDLGTKRTLAAIRNGLVASIPWHIRNFMLCDPEVAERKIRNALAYVGHDADIDVDAFCRQYRKEIDALLGDEMGCGVGELRESIRTIPDFGVDSIQVMHVWRSGNGH